jgi:PAS domain S-box-containing protein
VTAVPHGETLRRNALRAVVGIMVLAGLLFARQQSYLLFHTLAEFFSVVVACAIFAIFWNTRRFLNHGFFLILGAANLCVGALDLLHAMAYQGMGVFPEADANLPTQLWIAARHLQAVSVLLALLTFGRRFPAQPVLWGCAAVTAALAGLVLTGRFPDCLVPGQGLTPFKIVSEYVICAILIGSILFLVRRRQRFDPVVFRLFLAALAVMVASELAFTLYTDVYGPMNTLGHVLKILAFYLIYKAFIEEGLTKPYGLLFRDLKRHEGELERLNRNLEQHVAQRTDELAQSNRALLESERRFRALFNQTFQFLGLLAPDGTLLEVNDTALRFGGLSREDVVGRFFWEAPWWRLSEEVRSRLRQAIARAAQGEFVRYEVGVVGADGRVVTIDFSINPVRDESGNVALLIPEGRDISERIKAEREREELLHRVELSEERFRSLFEYAPDAIIISDPEGRIELVNARAADLFGYSEEELRGMVVDDLLPERHRAAHVRLRMRFFADNHPRTMAPGMDIFALRKDGEERPVEILIGPLQTPEGARALSVVRDIGERKRLEQALRQSERLAAIGQVMAGLSHESRNALQRSVAALQMLERRVGDDAELLFLLRTVLQAQQDLRQVYEDVRQYAAPLKLDRRPTSLQTLWRDTWEHLAELRQGRDARLVEDVDGVDLHCDVEAFRMQQVFRNLMENDRTEWVREGILRFAQNDTKGVIARSGRKRGTRPSATCCRHAAGPDSRALRKRRGNPEDLPRRTRPVSF